MLNWEGVTDTDEDRGLAEKECEVLGGGRPGWVTSGTVSRVARTPSTDFVPGWGEGAGCGEGRWRREVARHRGDAVERTQFWGADGVSEQTPRGGSQEDPAAPPGGRGRMEQGWCQEGFAGGSCLPRCCSWMPSPPPCPASAPPGAGNAARKGRRQSWDEGGPGIWAS